VLSEGNQGRRPHFPIPIATYKIGFEVSVPHSSPRSPSPRPHKPTQRSKPVLKFSLLDGMPNTVLTRFVLRSLSGLAIATAAYAQAAVEYAAKSSSSALSGSGGGARLSYPVVFYAATVAACVFVVSLLFRQGRRV
jgi:hypothetical protein